MNQNMPLTFVEDINHEYEESLQGEKEQTEDDKEKEPVKIAIGAARNHIEVLLGKGQERASYEIEECDDEEDL